MRGGGGKSLGYASMYSLSYRERRLDTVDGPRYDDLQSVTLSFEQVTRVLIGQLNAFLAPISCYKTPYWLFKD